MDLNLTRFGPVSSAVRAATQSPGVANLASDPRTRWIKDELNVSTDAQTLDLRLVDNGDQPMNGGTDQGRCRSECRGRHGQLDRIGQAAAELAGTKQEGAWSAVDRSRDTELYDEALDELADRCLFDIGLAARKQRRHRSSFRCAYKLHDGLDATANSTPAWLS